MAGKDTAEVTRARRGHKMEANNKKSKSKQEEDSKAKKKIVNGTKDNDEAEVLVVPDSASDSQNEDEEEVGEVAADSDDKDEEIEGNGKEDEDEDEDEEEVEEEQVKSSKITNSRARKGKKEEREDAKKKKIKKDLNKEKHPKNGKINNDAALYCFPMHRVSRMIKGEVPDIRISQEAVFLINKASEKFLELFTKEAYASAFLDHKKYVGYKHLSSVISKRRRLDFLSDFVPEKVKAEDALAEIPSAEP